ncbi:TrkA C-terminal domain-containing protein [Psychromonas sp. MME2]|uniref:TrkA C-terminal domain-containing protein n=1 Tax=Psychromonas sp. MME2 TaxID=3231033 RepID=UPI00339BB794
MERKSKYQNLHGFYYGQDSQLEKNAWLIEQIHAVVLSPQSQMIGSYIADFSLSGVIIKSLHRADGEEVILSHDTRFVTGDTVILQGEKATLLEAERILQRQIHESPI